MFFGILNYRCQLESTVNCWAILVGAIAVATYPHEAIFAYGEVYIAGEFLTACQKYVVATEKIDILQRSECRERSGISIVFRT